MTVYETDLPGVGRKFGLELDAGGEKLLDLNSGEANKLGSILEGAYFESVNVDELSVPLGDAIIEWVEVGEVSAIHSTSIAPAPRNCERLRISEARLSSIPTKNSSRTIPDPPAFGRSP